MSQNATPATEFAPRRHLTQPCQCDLRKTLNTTRPKCCACHENCNASSKNVAKVLRLPRKKRSNDTLETSKTDNLCKTTAIRRSYERLRTVANGCGRGSNVERTHPQPPDPQSETGTLATHSGKGTRRRLARERKKCFSNSSDNAQRPCPLPAPWGCAPRPSSHI